MEHQYDPRIDVQKNVLIHVSNGIFVNGFTRNISYGGLVLESDHLQLLRRGALVKAAFRVNGELIILLSQVFRVGENKAALMFIEKVTPPKKSERLAYQ